MAFYNDHGQQNKSTPTDCKAKEAILMHPFLNKDNFNRSYIFTLGVGGIYTLQQEENTSLYRAMQKDVL